MEQGTATSVYLYYDEHDVLIYVGITSRGMNRNAEHNRSKTWWPYVARQEVEHYDTRDDALSRETELIRTHRPPYNTQQNPDAIRSRATYEAVRQRLVDDEPVDLWRRLGHSLSLAATADGRFVIAPEHLPISRLLVLEAGARVVRGSEVVGRVTRVERQGPFVFVDAMVRRGVNTADAVAHVKCVTTKVGPTFALRRIKVA